MKAKSVPHGTNVIEIPELEEAARVYKPKYRQWTPIQEAILAKYYGKVEPALIAKHLNRSKQAIQTHAMKMGLKASVDV